MLPPWSQYPGIRAAMTLFSASAEKSCESCAKTRIVGYRIGHWTNAATRVLMGANHGHTDRKSLDLRAKNKAWEPTESATRIFSKQTGVHLNAHNQVLFNTIALDILKSQLNRQIAASPQVGTGLYES